MTSILKNRNYPLFDGEKCNYWNHDEGKWAFDSECGKSKKFWGNKDSVIANNPDLLNEKRDEPYLDESGTGHGIYTGNRNYITERELEMLGYARLLEEDDPIEGYNESISGVYKEEETNFIATKMTSIMQSDYEWSYVCSLDDTQYKYREENFHIQLKKLRVNGDIQYLIEVVYQDFDGHNSEGRNLYVFTQHVPVNVNILTLHAVLYNTVQQGVVITANFADGLDYTRDDLTIPTFPSNYKKFAYK
jgi:hypothetical protein